MRRKLMVMILVTASLAACGDAYEGTDSSPCTVVEASFGVIQSEVFSKSCAFSGCHGRGSKNAGLNLDANGGDVYENLVGVDSTEVTLKRVAAGDPENSYLVKKLEGKDIVEGRMPLTGAKLPSCKIQAVRDWIAAGAPKN
ncbi:MAG: hypothetical protein HYT87_10250 [Nitrospirae bacterium]|nr:hypothetical protein [Nitrospirota bacterium]